MTALLWRGIGSDGREALASSTSAEGASRVLGRTLGELRSVDLVGVPSPEGGAWVAPTPLDRAVALDAARPPANLARAVVERSASLHGVGVAAILGPGLSRRVVLARMACYWALRRAGWSFPEVGRALGRHHSTVIDGLRRYAPAPELARALEAVVLPSGECHRTDPGSASSIADTTD